MPLEALIAVRYTHIRFPPFQPVLNIRTFVLNVTQRLHSVEIERRSLIAKVNHWKKEATELRGAVEQTAILSRKVQELESMVCERLRKALTPNQYFIGSRLT